MNRYFLHPTFLEGYDAPATFNINGGEARCEIGESEYLRLKHFSEILPKKITIETVLKGIPCNSDATAQLISQNDPLNPCQLYTNINQEKSSCAFEAIEILYGGKWACNDSFGEENLQKEALKFLIPQNGVLYKKPFATLHIPLCIKETLTMGGDFLRDPPGHINVAALHPYGGKFDEYLSPDQCEATFFQVVEVPEQSDIEIFSASQLGAGWNFKNKVRIGTQEFVFFPMIATKEETLSLGETIKQGYIKVPLFYEKESYSYSSYAYEWSAYTQTVLIHFELNQ